MRGSGGGYTDPPRVFIGCASFRILVARAQPSCPRRAGTPHFQPYHSLWGAGEIGAHARRWQYRVFMTIEPAPAGSTRGRSPRRIRTGPPGIAGG